MTEDEKRLWNLDGKVVCSVKSGETENRLHLLALQESEVNLTIAQTALQAGENEISAGKRLLKKVDLTGKIVSGDAIFAQKQSLKTAANTGQNQGKIYRTVKEHFEKSKDKYLGNTVDLDKGHGRIEERLMLTSFRIAGETEFPHFRQVFRIEKQSFQTKTGKQSKQTIYGITSLPVEEFGAKELLELTRKHWRIENGLHYRRDVTFKEDPVHLRTRGENAIP
jgi:predicted transposase YbfD/YdcC